MIMIPEIPADWIAYDGITLGGEGVLPHTVVLRDLYGKYVTHRACVQDGQWVYHYGHYYGDNLEAAENDFERRSQKKKHILKGVL
jgi:hypothetical protein